MGRTEKGKFAVLSFLLAAFLCSILYFDEKSELKFSVEAGYYDTPFSLEIEGAEGCRIFYTLDGSEPTVDSIPYDGAIWLEDASLHENVYSARTDTSTGFYGDLIGMYASENPGYRAPDVPVDKCNIVRAAAFDGDGNCVDSVEGSYFVGFGKKTGYDGMWTVSLITEPENLFGYDKGIYETGRIFDEYRKLLPKEDTPFRSCWWWWDANYRSRGRDSERPAHVEIFDAAGQLLLSEDCGIRIQGRGSRGKTPKSLNVYARVEYAGSGEFSEDIFGMGERPHKFVIFSGADDSAYKVKDYLVHSMEAGLDFSTMYFKPAVLFLDGEYWGTYYVTESYNADYISDHYGVPPDEVVMVKEDALEEGREEEIGLYREMRKFLSEHDMTLEENFKKAQDMIDMCSYIDYYAAQIFIGRYGDWPGKNEGAWRSRNIVQGDRYADGRWRWMLFDVNSGSLSMDRVEADTLAEVLAVDSVFASLFQNEDFRKQFAERLLYIAEQVYAEEKVDRFIDDYLEQMLEPVCCNNRRFHGMELRAEAVENAENIRFFLKRRSEYMIGVAGNLLGENG